MLDIFVYRVFFRSEDLERGKGGFAGEVWLMGGEFGWLWFNSLLP
jgi:hypothetical protein